MKKLKILLTNFHRPVLDSFYLWQALIFYSDNAFYREDFFDDLSFFQLFSDEDFFKFYDDNF